MTAIPETVNLSTQNLPLGRKILNKLQAVRAPEKPAFLAIDDIQSLTGRDAIKKELEKMRVNFDESLLDFVCGRARRLILILALVEMIEVIPSFLQHNFDDDCLPIELDPVPDENAFRYRVRRLGHIADEQDTAQALSDYSQVFERWKLNDLRAFKHEQWKFLAPIFTGNPLHHNLHKDIPLPFVAYGKKIVTSFFSHVKKVTIHDAHQQVSIREGSSVRLALKRLERDGPRRFRREADALEMISKLNHPHLIQPVASYQQDECFSFLFPWADGGNLVQFWTEEKEFAGTTERDDALILWSLQQLSGLAGALEVLYHAKGRHGDLKPENILHFPKQNGRGTLQITDMGLAKFHVQVTKERKNLTVTKTGTARYEPPESKEDDPLQPRSRDYDVWSMGCIYMEFLIWLVDGREAVKRFMRRESFDHYWEVQEQEYQIQGQVQRYMEGLAERLNHGNSNTENALKSLLNLIRNRLLKVRIADSNERNNDGKKSPEGETRANAVELHRETRKIYERAMKDSSYIKAPWVRTERTANAPSSLEVPYASNQSGASHQLQNSNLSENNSADNLAVVISPDEQRDRRLNDEWETIPDKGFASQVYNKVCLAHDSEDDRMTRLCNKCKNMNIWEPGFKLEYTLSRLELDSTSCDLCHLFLESIQGTELEKQHPLVFNRVESRFISGPSGRTILSIYSLPITGLVVSPYVQYGLPALPRPGGVEQVTILNEWIRVCDERHDCAPAAVIGGSASLPTRVLDVGGVADPLLRLVDHDKIKVGRYVALSHSWGKLPNKDFCTRKENFQKYLQSIAENSLPKTFKDAIQITRLLQIRYLWIDSLCIIQDDAKDWDAESVRMEDVFSSAYVTLAASSAESSHAGFLQDREPRPFIKLNTPQSGSLYLCKGIDDFQTDVEHSVLSSRGWVLQERALSRRSIYFTSKQVYWECGDGVRCETLAKLRNSKAAFLGDSDFPKVSQEYFKGGKISLFQHLYKTYSELSFTRPQDRPVAIKGLEKRIGRTFDTRAGFGVFEKFLGRGLLWKWGGGDQLQRIDFAESRQVPSWSWMAYRGGIDYLEVPWEEVDWTSDVKNPFEYAQTKRHWDAEHRDRPLELTVQARDLCIANMESANGIVFDELSEKDYSSLRCVVIGKRKEAESEALRMNYVLIIKPVISKEEGTFYERVGVGSLRGNSIKLDKTVTVLVR